VAQGYRNEQFTGSERLLQLPMKKAFAISLQNIRVRFWRSMVTAAGIFLGIAFLATILINADVAEIVAKTAKQAVNQDEARQAASRNIWLVSMSLIVCTVGIANSMLMSVTERFKEIGTMKCLGALDSFVRRLFMLEAAFLGILASGLGWIFGTLVMFIVNGFSQGWNMVIAVGITGYLRSFVICVVVGTILTLLATIFPAQRASRLPPAAALRSEV
jgi:predicted lysophospholipase L1 biosynthesis ABC-type transport system permease subunit